MTWIVVMLGAALFFALNHILKKKILENADVLDMMILTAGIGFLCMLPVLRYVDFDISLKILVLIFINAVFAVTGSFLLNIAYKNCEISTVSPLLNINPVFIIILSYYVLGEVLNRGQFAGVILILVGGYMITLKKFNRFFNPFTSMPKKYFLIVLATLVLWSFCPVINRVVLFEVDVWTHMFFFVMFIFCIQLVVLIVSNKFRAVIRLARKSWLLLIVASLFWIVSDLLHLYAISIPTVVVSLVMPVKRISNLFTVILGGNLFDEKNLVMKSVACIVMLTGLFVIGFNA